MSKEYRVLLLGVGFFGSKWFGVLNEDESVRIVGAAGTRAEFEKLRAKGAVDFPTFEDYRDAIANTEADIALVVMPAPLHTDAALRAMAKGMHVLSEKPLAHSWEDALSVVERRKMYPDRRYVVDQNYRWRPSNHTVRRLLCEGIAGEVRTVGFRFAQPEDLTGYRAMLEFPLIQDVSIHHFDLLRFFTGRNCEKLLAHSRHEPWSAFAGKETSDLLIDMEGGIRVNYHGTWAARGMATNWDGAFEFTGDKGTLSLDAAGGIAFYPAQSGAPVRSFAPDPLDFVELRACLEELKNCIESDEPHETRVEENLLSFAMVCAAEVSSRRGEWVSIEELLGRKA